MNREERVAISILNAYKEGYESAIEDYKLQPCDDAISRKDAIKALQNVVCISAAIKSRMIGAIEELPSVKPTCEEREKGECS